jgi:hypothetical protein
MAIFEFFGQFFFQNDVFKLQEVFSELESRVFLGNGLGSFQTDFKQTSSAKKIPKQFRKKTKKPRYFGFRKIPCGLIPTQ